MVQKCMRCDTLIRDEQYSECPNCGEDNLKSNWSVHSSHFKCMSCYTLSTEIPMDGICKQCDRGRIHKADIYQDIFYCGNCQTLRTEVPSNGICDNCDYGPIRVADVHQSKFTCQRCDYEYNIVPPNGVCSNCGNGPVNEI